MEEREQPQSFTERVKKVAFADGADSAFDLLVAERWTVAPVENGVSRPGYRVFATVSWTRRILIRDSDGSLWALELEEQA
jgi:hypothetical protein